MNDNIDKYISLSEENLLDLIKNNQNEAFKFLFQKFLYNFFRICGYDNAIPMMWPEGLKGPYRPKPASLT